MLVGLVTGYEDLGNDFPCDVAPSKTVVSGVWPSPSKPIPETWQEGVVLLQERIRSTPRSSGSVKAEELLI